MWPPTLVVELAFTTMAIAFQRMKLLMRRSSSRSPGYGGSAVCGIVLTYGVFADLRFEFMGNAPDRITDARQNTNTSYTFTVQFLDLTLPTPAENLACDEALLDLCDAGGATEILRVWQPVEHFLVLGYSNKIRTEANLDQARQDGTPVLRRCTGGGAVLQGPGCLNYSLILRIPETGPLAHISETNQFIMEKHRQLLAPVVGPASRLATVCVQGHSDLTLGDLKFSGNAQRRRRRHLLFHGSFLLNLDVDRVERLLPLPSREPVYRHHRPHKDFLVNLGVNCANIQTALRHGWQAAEVFRELPVEQVSALARNQYLANDWIFKF